MTKASHVLKPTNITKRFLENPAFFIEYFLITACLLLPIHLGDDIYLSETKMRHLLKLPNDQRFTKDVMRYIWSVEELQQRSVTGQASRRLAKVGAVAKQAPTPRKVAAVKSKLYVLAYLQNRYLMCLSNSVYRVHSLMPEQNLLFCF